jgi:hypothetical protein
MSHLQLVPPPSLDIKIKWFADDLFQKHYLDLTSRPEYKKSGYKQDSEVKPLSPHARAEYSKFINFNDFDGALKKCKKEYFLFRSSLEERFQNQIPKFLKHPNCKDALELLTWFSHHTKSLTNNFYHQRDQEKFHQKFSQMNFLEIARDYPHLLRFQPCNFQLPESEDEDYWAKRTDAYLEKKCVASNLKHHIACYPRGYVSPSIGFYRVLSLSRERAKESIALIQKRLAGEQNLTISKVEGSNKAIIVDVADKK